jgi:rRNA maturation RNase YbeY
MKRRGHQVEITNLQRRRIPRACLIRAVEETLDSRKSRSRRVSLVLMNNRQISRTNDEFLGVKAPTDVITFEYPRGLPEGPEIEVLVSVEQAEREARRRRIPFRQELERYVVHGILHALGYNDATPGGRRAMHRAQEKIVQRLEGIRAGRRIRNKKKGRRSK